MLANVSPPSYKFLATVMLPDAYSDCLYPLLDGVSVWVWLPVTDKVAFVSLVDVLVSIFSRAASQPCRAAAISEEVCKLARNAFSSVKANAKFVLALNKQTDNAQA